MAQINKPNTYFNSVLYTGNGSTQSITGVGFQPDFVWIKGRSYIEDHMLQNSISGSTKTLRSNSDGVEYTPTGGLSSFDADGFSMGSDVAMNKSGENLVSWNWLAGGTAVSNTQGSITSNVSANTTSGFSVVSYTGNGTTVSTVGHGLGVKPSMIMVKNRDTAGKYWTIYTSYGTANSHIYLNETLAQATYVGYWNNTEPTSSVFTIGNDVNNFVNGSTNNFIAYCFAEKKGFSKFGSYTGNGSTDGTFVYTGFKPAFVMIKRSSSTGNWELLDNKRDIDNPVGHLLEANNSGAESDLSASHTPLDFLSNGFKLRNSSLTGDTNINLSGSTYIYMAFAEQPLVGTNNIPATAR